MESKKNFETRLFINNKFVESDGKKTFELRNPASEEYIGEVHEAQPLDVDCAVRVAQGAFGPWSELPPHERAACMNRLTQLIERDAEELAELDAICMGKPVELLKRMDIPGCIGVFRYFASCANHILGETSLGSPNFLNVTLRQPYGVVGLIIPWNVPLIMFAFKVAPAIVCGNTVVLKSSEKAPLSSLKMASLIVEAGFPPGVINVLSGFGMPTGSAIAMHMGIRKISFTGSTATGRKIMKMAADSNLKNVSLELGGKSPAIIFEDADVDAAVRHTHYSINHNSGQHCQANSRVLVHESIAPIYIERLKALMSKVTLGDPLDPHTFQGPQVDAAQLERVLDLTCAAGNEGKIVLGGARHGTSGAFMQPTILVDVPRSSRAYQDEIFGPVVIVNTFRTEEEALEEANSMEFGLFGSAYTKDFERALRVSKRIEAGAVGVNCSVPLRAVDMPIGGWKQSGIGKELSLHGLNMYTELKTVYMRFGEDRTSLSQHWHST